VCGVLTLVCIRVCVYDPDQSESESVFLAAKSTVFFFVFLSLH
jgi:hypothetical protein